MKQIKLSIVYRNFVTTSFPFYVSKDQFETMSFINNLVKCFYFFFNICHISNTVFTPTLNNQNKTNTWYACMYNKDLQSSYIPSNLLKY